MIPLSSSFPVPSRSCSSAKAHQRANSTPFEDNDLETSYPSHRRHPTAAVAAAAAVVGAEAVALPQLAEAVWADAAALADNPPLAVAVAETAHPIAVHSG